MSSCVLEIIQSVLQPRIYSTGFDSWDMPVSSKQMKNIFACASMFYLHSDWYFLIVMDVCKASPVCFCVLKVLLTKFENFLFFY
jgi:hypothetical protein